MREVEMDNISTALDLLKYPPYEFPTEDAFWDRIRWVRNQKLAACDWTQLPDAALTPEEATAWENYRQDLRDIPQTYVDPNHVVFPSQPNGGS